MSCRVAEELIVVAVIAVPDWCRPESASVGKYWALADFTEAEPRRLGFRRLNLGRREPAPPA